MAIDQRDGSPCYFQGLMGAEENARITSFFGVGRFPALREDEVLLENAYTPARYRGNGIMPAAMAQVAERGVGLGARFAITFVTSKNIASLNGCKKAGFSPFMIRSKQKMLFNLIHWYTFENMPPT
ncbi:GNAT family N-acetyltransferase [Methylobacterium nigriterrae]|uniref:GNAT family N-acetyltransferase n=1 Tax=Methylobacterium nigriterrae TaxID=3127512 RepID=UPI003013414C